MNLIRRWLHWRKHGPELGMELSFPTTAECAEEVGRRWLAEKEPRQRGVTVTYKDVNHVERKVRAGEPTWGEALLDSLRWCGAPWGLVR